MISTAGDALAERRRPEQRRPPGTWSTASFSLPQPLQARARNAANTGTAYNNVGSSASPLNLLTYAGPVSNDAVTLGHSASLINSGDALRTGPYEQDADLHPQHNHPVNGGKEGRRLIAAPPRRLLSTAGR